MKKDLKKQNWVSTFSLTGKLVITENSFKIDEVSKNGNWQYNAANIGVDCGEKFGTIWCSLTGGKFTSGETTIYAHGVKEDKKDDYNNKINVSWKDRENENILKYLGDGCFIKIALDETADKNNRFKCFLSGYDAVKYIKENASKDMIVNVNGNITYSEYNDKVQINKEIKSIYISNASEDKFRSNFVQSVLLDKYSASLKNNNKDKGVIYIDGIVLDYDRNLKITRPYKVKFEYPMDFSNPEKCKKIMKKLLTVTDNAYTQITFEGNFIESGATITPTEDDLTDDLKEFIEAGVYTLEEALEKCADSGNKERRMVLLRPLIKKEGDEKIPVIQKFEQVYKQGDLDFNEDDYKISEKDENNSKSDVDDIDDIDEDDSWLDEL